MPKPPKGKRVRGADGDFTAALSREYGARLEKVVDRGGWQRGHGVRPSHGFDLVDGE